MLYCVHEEGYSINYSKTASGVNTEFSTVLLISGNEFYRVISHPLALIVSCALFTLTIINALGNSNIMLSGPGVTPGQEAFIQYGMNSIFGVTLELCTLTALFIGTMSLAEEKTGKSLGILVIKPLYRRDVIVGKFLGLNTFILLLVAANFILCSVLLIVFNGTPGTLADFVLRLSAFILVVFLVCSVTMAVAMLIGIVLKDVLQATIVAMTYYVADSHGILNSYLGSFGAYTPRNLFSDMTSGSGFLQPATSITQWLTGSSPSIVMTVLEILAVLTIGLLIFSRQDE